MMKSGRLCTGQYGFTLVEAVIAIVITGILGSIAAVFITRPVAGYVDATRRAQLTDAADGTLRYIARDIQAALPNSVRVANQNGVLYLEFLPTRTNGRYQTDDTCFVAPGCSQLTTHGSVSINANDRIAIYNLYNNQLADCSPQIPSAYCANNTAQVTSASVGSKPDESVLTFPQTVFYPDLGLTPPGNRYQVIDGTQQAVTYICNPGESGNDGTGTLTRQWGYGINPFQATPPTGGTSALLAGNVSHCSFAYNQGTSQNSGLVILWLELEKNGEKVSLNQQVHVINVP